MSLDLEINLGGVPPTNPSGDIDLSARRIVPNVFPKVTNLPYKLAIIGEAPGADEETHLTPFIGASGHLLDNLLNHANILRNACFIGNVCQIRPPGNEISRFDWDGPEIQAGLAQLKKDLDEYNPNLVLLLGNTALRAGLGDGNKVTDWRGSLFRCRYPGSPLDGRKCLASLHPAAVLRSYEDMPLALFDLKRARRESESVELRLPERVIEYTLTASEICARLDAWPAGLECSLDIEGVLGNWSCIGISDNPRHAIISHWFNFNEEEHRQILHSLSHLCWRPDVPKCLQNSLYDNFVMAFGYKLFIRNVRNDTMLKGWEIYPELPKGLDTQASIYTLQPQWKYLIAYSKKEREKRQRAGVSPEQERVNKWIACGIDCSVTLEISNAQSPLLDGSRLDHYRLNIQLLEPLLYMQLRGIAYDSAKAKDRLQETLMKMEQLQVVLNTQSGRSLNFNSPKQLCEFFYGTKGFEPIYKKEHGRNTDRLTTDVEALLTLHKKYSDPAVATVLALRRLDSLRETFEITTDTDGRVRCGYNIVGTDTGRLTCYGSPTGSGANLTTITEECRELYTADSGYHFWQADLAGADGWTVAVRCKLLGDPTMFEDYLFGIKPAKVIALMYETLQEALELNKKNLGRQLKPFEVDQLKQKILVGFAQMDRQRLAEACERVSKKSWVYFACKRVQHGTNYGMGPITMCSQILKDSYKKENNPIFFPVADCKLLQSLYIDGRYKGVKLWQRWVENELLTRGRLWSASGNLRVFFGRKKTGGKTDIETYKAALSHEPQANTTYATNLAMSRLWNDVSNKVGRTKGRTIYTCGGEVLQLSENSPCRNRLVPGALIIEPLHQVHDALCGQFPEELTEWALPRIRSYFNNPLTIDGFQFVIPFEGRYGKSWGEQEHAI